MNQEIRLNYILSYLLSILIILGCSIGYSASNVQIDTLQSLLPFVTNDIQYTNDLLWYKDAWCIIEGITSCWKANIWISDTGIPTIIYGLSCISTRSYFDCEWFPHSITSNGIYWSYWTSCSISNAINLVVFFNHIIHNL